MSIKIRIPKSGGESGAKTIRGLPRDPVLRAALVAFLVLAVSFTIVFSYFYIKYDRIIEKRFRTPVFANSAKIYSLPRVVRDGEKIDASINHRRVRTLLPWFVRGVLSRPRTGADQH